MLSITICMKQTEMLSFIIMGAPPSPSAYLREAGSMPSR